MTETPPILATLHRRALLCALAAALAALGLAPAPAATEIREIRWGRHEGYARCVVEYRGDTPRLTFEDRTADLNLLYCDFWNVNQPAAGSPSAPEDPRILSCVTMYSPRESKMRLGVRLAEPATPRTLHLTDPTRIVIDFYWKSGAAAPAAAPGGADGAEPPAPALAAAPIPARPARKPVVILDPGHGGWHKGAIGRVGKKTVYEKDITLAIAEKLKRRLDATGRFDVRLTRTKDVYLGLYERVEFAEKNHGDLFISIHCNATDEARRKSQARGLEFWYWNKSNSGSAAAKYLEKLENDEGPQGALSQADPKARRLLGALMTEQLEARALQSRKASELLEGPFLRRDYFKRHYRGIHSARFKVLENYAMPSVLVEAGFLSHPEEAKLLDSARFQDQVAESLAEGVQAILSRPEFLE